MPFAEAEQVGLDAFVLDGEHSPGAPEAGRHLVADQQRAVPARQLAQRRQVAGRLRPHAGGALHERLDDERGDLAAVRGEDALGLGDAPAPSARSGESPRCQRNTCGGSMRSAGVSTGRKKRWNVSL